MESLPYYTTSLEKVSRTLPWSTTPAAEFAALIPRTPMHRHASTTMSSQPRVFFPPEPQDKHNRRKRKLFESSQSAPEKTAHSVVEKRYCAGINDKLAILRDSVPSLRVDKHSSCGNSQTIRTACRLYRSLIRYLSSFSLPYPHSFLPPSSPQSNWFSTVHHPLQSSRIYRPPRKAEQVPHERKPSLPSPHWRLRNPYNGSIRFRIYRASSTRKVRHLHAAYTPTQSCLIGRIFLWDFLAAVQ